MNMRDTFRGALRRIVDVHSASSLRLSRYLPGDKQGSRAPDAGVAVESARRTMPLPSVLTQGVRTQMRGGVMPKPTPANLRRFSEMPIARKAINTIKDRIAGMQWRVQPRHGRAFEDLPDGAERIAFLTQTLEQPNPDDSFRSLLEQVLEDVLVGGFGAIELDLSGQPERPLV